MNRVKCDNLSILHSFLSSTSGFRSRQILRAHICTDLNTSISRTVGWSPPGLVDIERVIIIMRDYMHTGRAVDSWLNEVLFVIWSKYWTFKKAKHIFFQLDIHQTMESTSLSCSPVLRLRRSPALQQRWRTKKVAATVSRDPTQSMYNGTS